MPSLPCPPKGHPKPRAIAQRWAIALGMLALAIAPTACTAQAAHPSRRMAVVRFSQEPDLLNPYLTGMSAGLEACSPVFEGLLTVDEQLRHVPVLAERVPSLENGDVRLLPEGGMAITYRLKRQVRWHDGKPFTAADVAFTQGFIMDPEVAVMERQGHDLVTKVEQLDPWTVRVRLREVYGPYLQLFRSILPAHRLGPGSNRAAFLRAPIGTGPFQLAGWVPGKKIVYAANLDWHGGRPPLDGLEALILPNDEAAFLAFKRGEIDLLLNVSQVERRAVERMGQGAKVYATAALQWEQLGFQVARPKLRDVRVRQAINLGLDREALARRATGGAWPAAWSDQHPRSWAHDPQLARPQAPNLAKAARLLDDAGWALGMDGVRRKAGEALVLRLATTEDDRRRAREVAYIQGSLQRLGIVVKPEFYPSAKLFASAPEGRLAVGDFDMAIWAWDASPDPDNVNLWHSQRIPPKGTNFLRLRDAALDAALVKATRTLKREDRVKLYRFVSKRLMELVPMIPLVDWMAYDASGPRLEGFKPNPSSAGNLWNVGAWRLRQAPEGPRHAP